MVRLATKMTKGQPYESALTATNQVVIFVVNFYVYSYIKEGDLCIIQGSSFLSSTGTSSGCMIKCAISSKIK